jgi:hypothetical protein
MLTADIRLLEKAIASTLRLKTKRVREILRSGDNAWRIQRVSGRGMDRCAIVPDQDELPMIVVYVPDAGGTLRMVEVLKVEPSDLDAWRALPAADRALPANMPVWTDADRTQRI